MDTKEKEMKTGEVLKAMSEQTRKQGDDLINMQKAHNKLSEDTEKNFKELGEKVDGMVSDVKLMAKKAKEDEEIEKSVYDLALGTKSDDILARMGYKSPIDAAVYRSTLEYDINGRKWVRKDGVNYGVSKDIMNMNDAIFLLGMTKAIGSQYTAQPKSYHDIVKGFDLYKIMKQSMMNSSASLAKEFKRLDTASKAMDLTENSDWVPTSMSASLLDDIRLQLRVASLFSTATMPAGSGSWDVPQRGAAIEAYLVAENTADTGQTAAGARTPSSGKVTFTAIKHALQVLHSYEIDEDNVFALMPFIREEIVYALAASAEISIINGDTTGTHMDSDITVATDVRKSFDGLRKESGNSSGNAAVDLGTFTVANLRSIRAKMGKYGADSSKLAWICSTSGYNSMISLEQVLTVDKFGPQATLVTGELAKLDNAPVIISEYVRDDLNASGVYDGITTNKTIILLVNTGAFWIAEKPSGIKVETERNIQNQQIISVASRRWDFKKIVSVATGKAVVGIGYNVST